MKGRAGIPGLTLTRADFEAARRHVAPHVYRTPMLTSRSLSEACGLDVRLKAELFQRGGSYKVRGPLNKIARLSDEERARGVICSSAGNHSQGVALAARQYGVRAVVVMAENATRCKIAAAASPVGALLEGLVDATPGTKTVCVLSGGNLDVEKLRGLSWN